ncbi:hypothetical protein GOP47_0001445 [Adiantum capillus-veneris]|uniref:Apoptosis regulatory protein Siva n=1 Tax=Adiantum capillus-veneris TaxID=13818 RepID=A0A9D4VA32_ADICA|nr:hypothetical protein GOP47_0001445 [Adiantum capillus-veneris]
MLGAKRQATGVCPDRPSVKLIKDDALSVYESTFLKLHSDKPPPIVAHPRVVNGNVEHTGCSQDLDTCLCKPKELAVIREKTTFNTACQGSADLSIGSSSLQGQCMSSFHGQMCFHCRRITCTRCRRQCVQCEEEFCSVCSILDFNERYDRAFCLDCYSSIPIRFKVLLSCCSLHCGHSLHGLRLAKSDTY